MIRLALGLLLACALAAGLLGCGGDDSRADGAETATATSASPRSPAATTGSPTLRPTLRSALARNRAGANRLVGDGREALDQRLAALKGEPVVVNLWASWCGPCRAEFPFFAAAVKRHDARVAFVGVDVMDSRDAAQAFLEEEPPGFASVYDGDGKAADALSGGRRAMPTTVFVGRDGEVVHRKLGGYANAEQLEADIRRHALGS